VDLPDDMLAGLDSATITTGVYVDPAQQTPYFLYGFGNTGPSGMGNSYLFSTAGTPDSGLRAAIGTGDWRSEQQTAAPGGLSRGTWHNIVYTVGCGKSVLYVDGVSVAHNDNVSVKPTDIGVGRTWSNYLGRSVYTADHYFAGKMKDVRLYNRVLSPVEVAALPSNSTMIGRSRCPN
jgi:concanavalin A-like lectin/glucanase superfamily protein